MIGRRCLRSRGAIATELEQVRHPKNLGQVRAGVKMPQLTKPLRPTSGTARPAGFDVGNR
jgi:hypothetical protein